MPGIDEKPVGTEITGKVIEPDLVAKILKDQESDPFDVSNIKIGDRTSVAPIKFSKLKESPIVDENTQEISINTKKAGIPSKLKGVGKGLLISALSLPLLALSRYIPALRMHCCPMMTPIDPIIGNCPGCSHSVAPMFWALVVSVPQVFRMLFYPIKMKIMDGLKFLKEK